MIVDTSAVVALVLGVPSAGEVDRVLRGAGGAWISAPTYVELAAVVDRRGPNVRRLVDDLLEEYGVGIQPFGEAEARLAREAYRDYGRGSGHPARLNLGDTFSYAMAVHRREPLLFVGSDFTHTDVVPALPSSSSGLAQPGPEDPHAADPPSSSGLAQPGPEDPRAGLGKD